MRSSYTIPFVFTELSYEDALAIAGDTGKVPGNGGPLLEIVEEMLDALGRPDISYDCLQIAGTNGKTSTARFTAAILRGEGLRTALYTSPELVHFEERIEVDGAPVSPEQFAHGVSAAAEAGRRVNERRTAKGLPFYHISPFDLLTCAAFIIFAEAQIDVAVLEVGMGGRWDATSAADPVAVAITGIGFDHMHILGNTLAEIAAEKAAIIKPGRTVILGEGVHEPSVQQVMDAKCRECGVVPQVVTHTTLRLPDRLGDTISFSCTTPRAIYTPTMQKPIYQPQNAACAIQLAEAYLGRALDAGLLEASLTQCPTPGRFDVLHCHPLVMIDACHNPQSCENFVDALDEISRDVAARPALLIAVLVDKDVEGIVRTLVPAFPRIAITQTDSSRALPAVKLAALVGEELAREGRPESDILFVEEPVAAAVSRLCDAGTEFVAAGTITLAGEVASLFRR